MLINNYFDSLKLNEACNEELEIDIEDIEEPEATNEGYDSDFGGFERAIAFGEASVHAIEIQDMVEQVKICNSLNESAINEANMLLENAITNFFKSVKNAIMKFWGKVKEVFNTAMMKIDKVINKSGFIARAKKVFSQPEFKNQTVETIEGYHFTTENVQPKKCATNMIKEIDNIFNAIDIPSGEDADFTEAKKAIEDAKSSDSYDRIAKASGISGVEKASDVKSAVFKELRGGTDQKAKVQSSPDTLISWLDDLSRLTNFVKAQRSEVDNIFRVAVAKVEAEEKEANTNAKEEGKGGYSSVVVDKCKAKTVVLNKTLNIAINIANAKLTAIKDKASQSRTEIMKAMSKIKKGNKSSEPEAQNNSALDSLMNSLGM